MSAGPIVDDASFEVHAGVSDFFGPSIDFSLEPSDGGVFGALTFAPEEKTGESHGIIVIFGSIIELNRIEVRACNMFCLHRLRWRFCAGARPCD